MPGGSGAGRIALVILLPLGIAGLVCGILCSQMRTARPKTEAAGYLSDEGWCCTARWTCIPTPPAARSMIRPRPRQILLPRSIRTDLAGPDGGKF